MEVILLERIAKLGQMGDIVSVKQGYARNYLLPQKKALRATEKNKADFEQQKVQLEAKNIENRNEAQAIADRLDGAVFVIIRSASDAGVLYGSVAPRDVAVIASEMGYHIDKKQFSFEKPIKDLGLHTINVKLHPEVFSKITLNIARSQEEAELQASGKSVQELAADAEAQAEAEIAEMFDDIGAAAAMDDDNADEADQAQS